MIQKNFLYVNRRAPHGSIHALEALEVVLIGAAFDQHVSVLFMDDGVYQLKKKQDPRTHLGIKNFSKTFQLFEDYEVEVVYVEKEALQQRGLNEDDLIIPVNSVSTAEIQQIMKQQDCIFSF